MKRFEEMTELEKQIHNTEFILQSHKEALTILENNQSKFMPQLTMIAAIEKLEKELDYLKSL